MSKKFRNVRVKYQGSSIGFNNLAYLQSIENKCKVSFLRRNLKYLLNYARYEKFVYAVEFYSIDYPLDQIWSNHFRRCMGRDRLQAKIHALRQILDLSR